MENLLSVQNLVKSFRGDLFKETKTVLHGINFGVPKGKTTGFVGVNGSGKTTTLMCIFGFVRPDTGKIIFNGKELSLADREQIGFLPERPQFQAFLTGREFLRYHWELSGRHTGDEFENRISELLELVDLTRAQNGTIRTYSKGMVQRLGLCQALLTKPKLLILDEPMSGLDPEGRLMARRLIKAAAEEGTTIFFSSHLMQDIEELCSDVVVIDQGKILFSGKIGEIEADQASQHSIRYQESGLEKELALSSEELQRKIDELRSTGCEIIDIRKVHRPLEEVFQSLRYKGRAS